MINDLYRCALATLVGEDPDARTRAHLTDERRDALLAKFQSSPSIIERIRELPASYLAELPVETIEEHLHRIANLKDQAIEVVPTFQPTTNTTTYTVIANEQTSKAIFSKIAGGLAAHHLDVLSAGIYTLADGTVIDQFEVRDPHYFGDPSSDRVKKVANTIRNILLGELTVQDALYATRSSVFTAKVGVQAPVDTRVTIDNSISEASSVIDVFTNNRRGLLFTLAQGIARLGLSVKYAKIATYEDEAADVFYVQDLEGRKIESIERIKQIQSSLKSDVQHLADNPRSMGF